MQNKIALVTSGITSIGTAICRQLSAKGAQVIAGYHHNGDYELAKNWEIEQRKRGYEIMTRCIDVSNYESCDKSIREIENEFKSIDVLINNENTTDNTVEINFKNLLNITMTVITGMAARYYGRIINVSTVNLPYPLFQIDEYKPFKDRMHGFTECLSKEFASKGITINTISPGYFEVGAEKSLSDELRKEVVMQIAAGRLGRPDEIARIACFLASKDSSYITNTNVLVDGGLMGLTNYA